MTDQFVYTNVPMRDQKIRETTCTYLGIHISDLHDGAVDEEGGGIHRKGSDNCGGETSRQELGSLLL